MLTDIQIRTFLTLCETLNYTETARRLFTSHQAISKQIQRLEEELGHTLFVRSTRNVSLSAIGELYYAFFKEQSDRFSDLNAQVEQLARSTSNDIRIGLPLGMTPVPAVEQAIRTLQEELPTTHIHMEWYGVDDLSHYFRNGLLDLAISLEDSELGTAPGLSAIRLCTCRAVLAYPNRPCYQKKTSLSDFDNEVFYYDCSETQERTRDHLNDIKKLLASVGILSPILESSPNYLSLASNVQIGLGCAVIIDQDSLCFDEDVLYLPLTQTTTGIHCYYSPDAPKQALKRLVELIREAL